MNCRADSQLLMNYARSLRKQLVQSHWPDKDLPKLIGQAGRNWFTRWRTQYRIVKNKTGLKLTASWAKVHRRVAVLMGNMFRLRAFWELPYPGRLMGWLSVDQKPSWFNNAGHTGALSKKGFQQTIRESFAATRQRYTILTSVPSWGHEDPDKPPKVGVLFKGKPDGRILGNIASDFASPP